MKHIETNSIIADPLTKELIPKSVLVGSHILTSSSILFFFLAFKLANRRACERKRKHTCIENPQLKNLMHEVQPSSFIYMECVFPYNFLFVSNFFLKICEGSIPNEPYVLPSSKICGYCGATKFYRESKGFCCCDGNVKLQLHDIPPEMYDLFNSTSEETVAFRKVICSYNNHFAFTSFGVKYDKELCKNNKGIYTFKVQRQEYHFINSLVPKNENPTYLQLYFYDTENKICNRLNTSDKFCEFTLRKLIDVLNKYPYSKFFRSLSEVSDLESCCLLLKSNPAVDQRVYNLPISEQVAVVWVNDDRSSTNTRGQDLLIYEHSGNAYKVQYYYGCYDPLQYPLLFPYGEPGWHEVLKAKKNRITVSCREYYCYKLQIRCVNNCILLHAGRLLQQYVVDIYVKIETVRLDYFRNNQKVIRAELYRGIVDSVQNGENKDYKIGKSLVLPSCFIGGPRNMTKRYMDAMSLVQRYVKPDVFLTMTCNPNWREIKCELKHSDEIQNIPDLLVQIFRAKFEELKTDLVKRKLLGPISAYVYKYQTKKYPYLHATVVKHMMHDPCGNFNHKNVCVEKNFVCKNKYPRDYIENTSLDNDSYPLYNRRNDGVKVKLHTKDAQMVTYKETDDLSKVMILFTE
ncbi:uncharacterized protein LOC111370209 [Olea europaea var. sylvestris]|uniref:uncharacterized protein LOC111370209 n=1 Tax=Olea europaea var. sylvestris TaxID=158386 RepID=UPI000C1D3921|nr:uncharacterized protein LOC111370209 [Olea europaea var. sylvestris]